MKKELFKLKREESDNIYSPSTRPPQYEIREGITQPNIAELLNYQKYAELIKEIKESDISEEEKTFLTMAASRHIVFNYSKIAEYYTFASKEVQELMEKSALVIIDFKDALANGYIKLSSTLDKIIKEEKRLKELNEK